MKNTSYLSLSFFIVGILTSILLLLMWGKKIAEMTFVDDRVMVFLLYTALALAVVTFLLLVKRLAARLKTKIDYLKAFVGITLGFFVLYFICFYIAITTLIVILPGTHSDYMTTFQYSKKGSRTDCVGAKLHDPIQGEIKICHPDGDLYDGNKIYVEKRSNALGFVVTYAKVSL